MNFAKKMTKYIESILNSENDLLIEMQKIADIVKESINANGNCCSINVKIDENYNFNAKSVLVKSFPCSENSGSLPGGEYSVVVNRGLILKLAYAFELITSVYVRIKDRGGNDKNCVLIHNNQMDDLSKILCLDNFFKINIYNQLMNINNNKISIYRFAETVENYFWPFKFHGRQISKYALTCLELALNFICFHDM